MVGEHLNMRLALCLKSPTTIASQALRGGGCLQGHCCCCYSVHCPIASCRYGNRPFWASHVSAWQCPMVGLLGATELFGRLFKALTWNIANYFLMRSSKIISPGQILLVLLNLGALGKLQLASGLGGTRPSPWRSMKPSSTGSPHRGTAHPTRGQGRR